MAADHRQCTRDHRAALADAVAAEWAAQGETIDPVTMPLTRIANSVVEGVVDRVELVAEDAREFGCAAEVASAREILGPDATIAPTFVAPLGPDAEDLARALAARSRSACGPVAPASGLCLVRVDY